MATRSRIGILHSDGSIHAHYCHSDGYFSWNGKMIHEHYQDPKKIQKLIDLGDMSVLQQEIGKKHNPNWRSSDERDYDAEFQALTDEQKGAYLGTDGRPNRFVYRIEVQKTDPRYRMCSFFKRDSGLKDCGPVRYETLANLAAHFEEFLYLWDEERSRWIAAHTGGPEASELVFYTLADLAAAGWPDPDTDDTTLGSVPTTPFPAVINPYAELAQF